MEIPITQPPTLKGTARVVSKVTAKPRVTLGLRVLTHLYGVIIYLALGYEVLRKRKCDHMALLLTPLTHPMTSSYDVIMTSSYK